MRRFPRFALALVWVMILPLWLVSCSVERTSQRAARAGFEELKLAVYEEVEKQKPALLEGAKQAGEAVALKLSQEAAKKAEDASDPKAKLAWGLLAYVLAHLGRRGIGKVVGSKSVAAE